MLKLKFNISEKFEGILMATIVFIIGASFISPRCLEPVELKKNLAKNRDISIPSFFQLRVLYFFLTRLL